MKIVLDTNVLVVSVSPKSKYRWIFDLFLHEKITLCVTLEIMLEYEEIITKLMNRDIAKSVIRVVKSAPNTELVTKFFQWELMKNDPDDNKFVDCAIASSAAYIVSEDKHFNILEKIDFPQVEVIGIEKLRSIVSK
ncbi:MAG: putative toxin-antitoxin system toxin component, PIN family [Ekhidna sp.]|uniref:putative toxin-antitoxin system toxin component, PIN family n=1 Tax=Ekhidna sp. TaxID=2608089 RepID=UPI0032EE1D56